jgi:hypothetical protein
MRRIKLSWWAIEHDGPDSQPQLVLRQPNTLGGVDRIAVPLTDIQILNLVQALAKVLPYVPVDPVIKRGKDGAEQI